MARDPSKPKPEQYRAILDPERYGVLFEENTERPFTSPLNDEKRAGTFVWVDPALGLVADRSRRRLCRVRHLGLVDCTPAPHAMGLCGAVCPRARRVEFH